MNDPGDPAVNYTVPQSQASGMRIPEFVLRQLIGWSLQRVREAIGTPACVVDEVFAQTPDDFRKQVKAWLREHANVYLDVSWPREDQHLPMIVVEPQGEQEATAEAFLNDRAGMVEYGTLGDVDASERAHYAVPEKHSTLIYVGATDDRLTLALYVLVKFILLSNKHALTEWYDIHNLSLSGQVLSHDAKQLPTFGYYRVLSATYDTLFDWDGTEEASKIVRVDLAVEMAGVGLTTVVSDP